MMNPSIKEMPSSPTQGSKSLSMFLECVALSAMLVSMWMNARFGWGLSPNLADRLTIAILHILVDPAAAGLVVTGGLMIRWGWRWQGVVFLVIALLLISYSMLSVYGFMSSRIAMTQSHHAVVEMQKGQWDWISKSSVNREVPKQERQLLRAEAKELSKTIQVSLSIIPDAQAASIASAIGMPVAKVQHILLMITSGIAQTIKFLCLLGGIMVWPRRKDDAASKYDDATKGSDASSNGDHDLGPGSPAAEMQEAPASTASLAHDAAMMQPSKADQSKRTNGSAASRKISPTELQKYLHQHALGLRSPLSQRQMALETGWHQSSVSRKLSGQHKRLARWGRRLAPRMAAEGNDTADPKV